MRTLRIATWNMAYWQHKSQVEEAWDFYLNDINADFYLFQEAKPLDNLLQDTKHLIWEPIGGHRNWGSGIYSKQYEINKEEIDTAFKGAVVIGNTSVENISLTLVSIYGLMENRGPTKGYSISNLHRMLSDLTGIFNGLVNGRRNVILGGDLNASLQFDEIQRNNSHRIFFDRLEDFKLDNVYKLSNNEEFVQTLRHSKSNKPWQNDYFFISRKLSKGYKKYEIMDNENIRRFSDHNILIIQLEV